MLFSVNVTFYDVNNYISDVRWIPNSHYSGINGLFKLTYPKIINLSLTNRIIILDTDLILTGDIYDLWKLFDKFKHQQVCFLISKILLLLFTTEILYV